MIKISINYKPDFENVESDIKVLAEIDEKLQPLLKEILKNYPEVKLQCPKFFS